MTDALPRPARLLHVMSVPQTLGFFRGQPAYFRARGFDFQAVASPGGLLEQFGRAEGATVHAVPLARAITPLADLVALWRLRRLMRRLRPTIVHAHTPKGGLLGMLAAQLTGVPVRVYHIHGLPLLTALGLTRRLLRWSERLSCFLAHQVLCVSPSVREVAVAAGLCPPEKLKVLCQGSINGVEVEERFDPARLLPDTRARVRASRGLPEGAAVLGFIGRIVMDKGWRELFAAWCELRAEFPELHLLIVGELDERDAVPPALLEPLRQDPRVRFAGFREEVAPELAAMDLVLLPSHREGFGVSAIEASAMGLPVVATRIPGTVDAVVDGVTGTLVEPRDAAALAGAIRRYLRDPELARRHGAAGRERVLRDFRPEDIWAALYNEYVRLLREKGIDVPAADEPAAAP